MRILDYNDDKTVINMVLLHKMMGMMNMISLEMYETVQRACTLLFQASYWRHTNTTLKGTGRTLRKHGSVKSLVCKHFRHQLYIICSCCHFGKQGLP